MGVAGMNGASDADDEVRPIPGWPHYLVTRDGRARKEDGRWLNPWISKKGGTPLISLHIDRKRHTMTVGRAMLLAWVGPCPEGMEAAHLDGVITNNVLSNLAWRRRGIEAARVIRDWPAPRGEQHKAAKLTEADVHAIRRLFREGKLNGKEIGALFGVGVSAICKIRAGTAWGWLADEEEVVL